MLFTAAPAHAGTYTVESCTNGSISGWSPFYWGSYSGWGNSCGLAGGGMGAAISIHPGSTAGWKFTAPADTEIAGFRLTRTYGLAANQPFGTSVVTTATDGAGQAFRDARPNFGGATSVGPELQAASGLRGQRTLTAHLDCGGGSVCTGNSVLIVHGASIDLRDDAPPALGSVSGSLTAAGAVKGTRALSYAATDRGGGIRTEQLQVDGEVRATRPLDCSFALTVPCPPATTGTFALDTTRLADGEHEAALVVTDATLANRATHGPFVFVVDNVPPPLATSAPRIYGGIALYADDGAWTGEQLTFTRRWQRDEHGAWEDIAGAEHSIYTPGAEDAGHRLRFRVRASNAEGIAEAFSDPTARLPVPAAPTPTPTATQPAVPGTAPAASAPAPAPAASTEPPRAILTAAFPSTGRTTVTVRWGDRRKVTGTLTRADGRPLARERIAITSRISTSGAVALPLGHVLTDGAGRFAYLPPAGVARTLAFTHGAASATVTIRVVPHITIRVTRSGRIEGRVRGAPAGRGKLVQLQALRGRTWRTFATTRLRPTGGTFSHHPRKTPRRVRARVAAEPGWPFLTGTSSPAARGPA